MTYLRMTNKRTKPRLPAKAHQTWYTFSGGPWDGKRVSMSDPTGTLPITVNGYIGRYVNGNRLESKDLIWQPDRT